MLMVVLQQNERKCMKALVYTETNEVKYGLILCWSQSNYRNNFYWDFLSFSEVIGQHI